MLTKSVTYENLADETVTEDFEFHFTKLELLETQFEWGDIEETIEELTRTQDAKKAYDMFKSLILSGYGRRSSDRKFFYKKDPLTGMSYADEFAQSPALSELILEFLENPDAASEFLNACIPAKLREQVEKAQTEGKNPDGSPLMGDEVPTPAPVAPPAEPTPAVEKTWQSYSREELMALPKDEFDKIAGTDPTKMPRELLQVAFHRKGKGL